MVRAVAGRSQHAGPLLFIVLVDAFLSDERGLHKKILLKIRRQTQKPSVFWSACLTGSACPVRRAYGSPEVDVGPSRWCPSSNPPTYVLSRFDPQFWSA